MRSVLSGGGMNGSFPTFPSLAIGRFTWPVGFGGHHWEQRMGLSLSGRPKPLCELCDSEHEESTANSTQLSCRHHFSLDITKKYGCSRLPLSAIDEHSTDCYPVIKAKARNYLASLLYFVHVIAQTVENDQQINIRIRGSLSSGMRAE